MTATFDRTDRRANRAGRARFYGKPLAVIASGCDHDAPGTHSPAFARLQPSVSPLEDMGFGTAVDANGNSYVAGRTKGVLEGAKTHGSGSAVGDLDADPATANGGFVMRCDQHGEPRWIRQGFAEVSLALAAGADGGAHSTGWLFDPEMRDAELDGQAFSRALDAAGTRSLLTWFGSSAP